MAYSSSSLLLTVLPAAASVAFAATGGSLTPRVGTDVMTILALGATLLVGATVVKRRLGWKRPPSAGALAARAVQSSAAHATGEPDAHAQEQVA